MVDARPHVVAARPRVHLMGGDGGGWALDDDLAQVSAALGDAVERAPLETAEIVHSVWWDAVLNLPTARLAGRQVICQLSGEIARYLELPRFHAVLSRVDRWITQSRQGQQQLASLGIESSLVPYAVDRRQFCPLSDPAPLAALRDRYAIPRDRYLIGSFQRDTVQRDLVSPKLVKGPDVFCEIVRLALDLGAPVHVVLGGPRRSWIRSRLDALAVPYTFVGDDQADDRTDLVANTLPRSTLNQLYNLIDLCLIASRSEGGPRAALEAPAAGCKLLSSRVGITPDVLPAACLFEDPAEAAHIIAADAAGDILAAPSAEAHRAVLERHTPEAVQQRLLQAYAGLPRTSAPKADAAGRRRRIWHRLWPVALRLSVAEPASEELQRLRAALGRGPAGGCGDLHLVPARTARDVNETGGRRAVVVAADDIAGAPIDVEGALAGADVVVADSFWTFSQLGGIERFRNALLVRPDTEGPQAPLFNGQLVTVGVCAPDAGEADTVARLLDGGRGRLADAEAAEVLVVRGLCPPPTLRAALRRGALVVHDGHPWVVELCGFAGLYVPDAADLPTRIANAVPHRAMHRRLLVHRSIENVVAEYIALARHLRG